MTPACSYQASVPANYKKTAVITEYSEKKATYPICVPIGRYAGLKKHSIVNLSQIRTIDNRRLTGPKIADLTDEIMEKFDMALRSGLAL